VLELRLGVALRRLRPPPAAFAAVLGGGFDAALAMAGNRTTECSTKIITR
jgi:hypothetical protein